MALVAEGLRKSYHGREVVCGVDFTVERGEIVGLLGPNGAGKTTAFYLVLGLVPCDAGKVMLDGRDLASLPMHIRCRQGLGYLAQEPSVFRKLSVRDNLLLILEMQKIPRRRQLERAEELMAKLDLTRLAGTQASVLSGGERRRVELARALCTQPSFILLDEPFSGIDPIAVAEIQDIIARLRDDDIGILVTDHNVREMLGIADRAYVISEGHIRTSGTSAELLVDPIARRYYLGERFRM
jgi:lipopolysaccharide export system ATP-binding protein